MRRRVATAAVALAVYVGLVVWLTWPLVPNAATHLPDTNFDCRYDTLYMVAVVSHESRALLSAPSRFLDLNIYHPAEGALFYGDTGFSLLPYFLPTFALTGNPTLASNLAWLGCVALTAWTLHLVVLHWTGSWLAGLISGWAFLMTPWVLWSFIPAAPSYSVLQYFPLIVLLASKPAPSFLAGLPLLPLVVLQCLTDVAYVAPAVLAPLLVLAIARLLNPSTRAAGARLLGVLGLALVLLSPVYIGHLLVALELSDIGRQTIWWGGQQIVKVFWTALPWGPFQSGPAALPAAVWIVLVLGALGFAARAVRRDEGAARQAWLHAVLWAVVGILISITPRARWQGEFIRLPHHLIELWTPLYQLVRDPARLAVAALIGLTLLAGLAFAECARRLSGDRPGPRRTIVPIALALVVAVAMYVGPSQGEVRTAALGHYPIAVAIAPDSPIIDALREPGGPLLELPIGRLGGAPPKGRGDLLNVLAPVFQSRAMYRTAFHDRPLLNGYSGYWPPGFPERMELARRLPDPAALDALRAQTGLELVLVHTDDLGRSEREACAMLPRGGSSKRCAEDFGARERAEWLRIAEQGSRPDLRLMARDGGDLLFAVLP